MKATQNIISKSTLILFILIQSVYSGFSQNVAVNSTGTTPDASAMLDVSSTVKGLLIPRVSLASLTDVSTIATPATSLLLYNTNASLSGGVGFYYNAGSTTSAVWTKLVTTGTNNGSTWGLTGNAGTDSSVNYLGTTDVKPLIIKTNNTESMRVQYDGKVGVGVIAPSAALHLKAGGTTAGTAPLKLTSQVAPLATVEQGTFELVGNSLQFSQLAKRRGIAMSQSVLTADVVVGNSLTESAALITAEHGANYLEVGKMEEITLHGIIQQTTSGNGVLTIRTKYAGVTIITAVTTSVSIAANTPYEIHVISTCRSTGASGTLQVNAHMAIDGMANGPDAHALVTINTTIAQNTTITAQWSVANASNTMTINQGSVLCIEPNR